MTIAIIGCGLMGPAAACNAMRDPAVDRVLLLDNDTDGLERAMKRLAGLPGVEKLAPLKVDLADRSAAARFLRGSAAAVSALPWQASLLAFNAALDACVPIVDLAIPDENDCLGLREEVEQKGGFILLGCGLEPGLTEIMTRYLAARLDRVDEVHIKCGGIPEVPTGPLGYKIVFGGRTLPLRAIEALVIADGASRMVPRYSGLEEVEFEGVGRCEAWHEGVLRWMLDLPSLAGVRQVTQKTLRWPGYAARATTLNELGLLSQEPVEVDGVEVIPKNLVDTLLYPHVRLNEGEGDITLFRVDLIGERNGEPVHLRADMVDRMDRATGFTSMARTTAFTGAIVARMIARGELAGTGLHTAEEIIDPVRFEGVMAQLAEDGILFRITSGSPS